MANCECAELTETELNDLGYYFEQYGAIDGCIVAHYMGNDAKFAGQSMAWSRQPIVHDWFSSKAAAIRAVNEWRACQPH